MEQTNNNSPRINRKARRKMKAESRKRNNNSNKVFYDDKVVYNDDSYKDTSKKVFSSGLSYAKERINALKQKFTLPTSIKTLRVGKASTAVIINKEERERDFLPNIPAVRKILVHGSVAKEMVSNVCILVRPTNNYDEQGNYIDGSWAITPAEYRMMNVTTIQHVKRRKWWFLRKYWYEISFDGRVCPAHLLFDYELNPTATNTKLYITKEVVNVKGEETKQNTYFRFWKNKP